MNSDEQVWQFTERMEHEERMSAMKELIESSRPYERVMVFIDGAYLRSLCRNLYEHDNIRFAHLSWVFIRMFNTYGNRMTNPFKANLVRIYYYDAIVYEGHPDYEAQRRYFQMIDDQYAYTVKLGKMVESSTKGFKQKGVDILMAIDALTRAYRNQYDVAMFMMGDADFIPLIEAVKDAGKKTICIYYPPDTSKELIRTCDMRISFDKKAIKSWLEN